jgi:hypothetical protein
MAVSGSALAFVKGISLMTSEALRGGRAAVAGDGVSRLLLAEDPDVIDTECFLDDCRTFFGI